MSKPGSDANPTTGSQAEPVNPFIGAESFRTGDKIFGRDSEIDEFATRLLARRIVLLNSPSGAGKTSLVQAGVIPALNKKGVHIYPKVRLNNELPADKLPPGARYNRYLASMLMSLDAGLGVPEEAHLSYAQIANLSLKPAGAAEYLETHVPYARDTVPKRRLGKTASPARGLIFFDQFEEVLTLDATDADTKKDFFIRLALLLNDYRTVAIFAMREEYVAGLEPYLVYLPERLSARFRLELLGKEAAMDAIIKPVRSVHVNFERKGAELLVKMLSQVTVREGGQDVKKDGQFVEPVQLQVVCRDLFERSVQARQITKEDVEKQGSIENALGTYYDKKIKEVALNQLEAERAAIIAKQEQAKAAWLAMQTESSKTFSEFNNFARDRQVSYLEAQVRRIEYESAARKTLTNTQQGSDMLKQELEALQELLRLFDAEARLADPEKAIELERKLRDWIEQELIVSGRLRGQAIADEETRFGLDKSAIVKLIQAFIVREEPRRGLVWYELAHDSLVRPVVASNAAWRELHANEFEIQAARWYKAPESDRERLLPGGDALRQAVAWGEGHLESLSEAQKAYLSAARRELSRLEVRKDNLADLGVNLEDTGWGVIFAANAPSALREALKELLDHRRMLAGRIRSAYYREFSGANGYRPGETAQRFLARWEAGSGLANPEKMPYYLLIVGDPETIPFEFQYGLDVQYAVGRIYFETLEDYARYARSVVLSETKHADDSFSLPNRLVLFNPQHPGDQSTQLMHDYLSKPLIEALPEAAPNWDPQPLLAENATKANLKQVLGGPQTPALLFTASHGMGWPTGNPEQLASQGALVCQDWPGPENQRDPFTAEYYFSADDVPADGNLLGTMIFSFGEFIGGTPKENNFAFLGEQTQLAEKAFLARLPQRLLSHPRGGALAMVAHVDNAWSTSIFNIEQGQTQDAYKSDITPFLKLLSRLMQGSTVGMAMEDFNRRYSFFSSSLADELMATTFYNRPRDENKLQQMMIQTIDARNYILIGDPAARLPVRADRPYQTPPSDWERPVIGAVSAPAPATEEPPLQVAVEEEAFVVEAPAAEIETPTPPPATREAVPELPVPISAELEGISLDSLASALLKGQKLKLGNYK